MVVMLLLVGCPDSENNASGLRDYVSSYNFDSARLEDLPWQAASAIVGVHSSFEYADYISDHHPGWNCVQFILGESMYMEHTDSNYVVDDPANIVPGYERVDSESFSLKDGCFYAESVFISNGVAMAEVTDYFSPPFKLELEVLRYEDFNHDGYLDVILKRWPQAGSANPHETLVVSRKGPDEMFYVVDTIKGGSRSSADEYYSWEQDANGNRRFYRHVYVRVNGRSASDIAKEYGVDVDAVTMDSEPTFSQGVEGMGAWVKVLR